MYTDVTSTQHNFAMQNVTAHHDNSTHNAVYITTPYAFKVVCDIIGVLGICLNIFTIFVLRMHKPMRKGLTNAFILNQSVIDGMAALFLLLTTIYGNDLKPRTPGNFHDEALCRLWFTQVPMYAMLVSSNYSIVVLTFERFLSIVYPIWHKTKLTKGKVAFLMSLAWIGGIALYFSIAITTSKITDDGLCTIFVIFPSDALRKFVNIFGFVLIYLLPLSCLCYFYIKMALAMRRKVAVRPMENKIKNNMEGTNGGRINSDDETRAQNNSSSQNRIENKAQTMSDKARKNIIKTLVLVGIGFVVCWSWSRLYFLMFHLGYTHVNFSGDFFNFTVAINFVSCCINPIIYSIQYQKFQSAVTHLFCRRHQTPATSNPAKSVASSNTA